MSWSEPLSHLISSVVEKAWLKCPSRSALHIFALTLSLLVVGRQVLLQNYLWPITVHVSSGSGKQKENQGTCRRIFFWHGKPFIKVSWFSQPYHCSLIMSLISVKNCVWIDVISSDHYILSEKIDSEQKVWINSWEIDNEPGRLTWVDNIAFEPFSFDSGLVPFFCWLVKIK